MQRHEALATYLAELGLAYGEERSAPIPVRLTHNGSTIELEPWEQTILQESLCGPEAAETPPWAPLLAESLAFRMKCLRRSMESEPIAEPDEAQAETIGIVQEIENELEQLVTDTAVGLALLEETQRAIDRLVVSGEIASAKKLTAFRHKVCQAVGELKEEIGNDEFERAENKSEGMVAPTEQMVSSSSGPVPAGAWVAGTKRKGALSAEDFRETGATSKRVEGWEPVSHTKSLGLIFGAVLVVWMIFFMPRLFKAEPHVLQRAELLHIPGVMRVDARPPSVFVTIDAIDWNNMTPEEQIGVVEQIGIVASETGYVGADIRGDDGVVLGRWFKERGAELVAPVLR